MDKKLPILAALSILTLGLSGCMEAHNAMMHNKPVGKYEKTSTSTDDRGTTTEQQDSDEVIVDEDGKKKEIVKSKTTKDPKGLWNKTTTKKSTQVIKER